MIPITQARQNDAEHDPSSSWGHPLWRLGFRPFYLLASAFAAIGVPLWIARYFGWMTAMPNIDLNWHMHEMVFGFAVAVVIGFLLTASKVWTGLQTPRGTHLAVLAGVWLAGRVAMATAAPIAAAAIDCLFIPLAAWPLYRVLRQSGNKRNLFLVALLGLLVLANAAFHAAVLGWISLSPISAMQGALFIIVMIASAIGARVIPSFTANAVPGTRPIMNPLQDAIGLALIAATGIAWLCQSPPTLIVVLAAATGGVLALRSIGYMPHRTLRQPLLWILHLAYAWIPIGFFILALAAAGLVSSSAAFHAFAVGAIASLIIGMMTRTALGHTGRPLKAGRAELAMYVLIQVGAVARLCAAIGVIDHRNTAMSVAMISWSAAFFLYLVVYGRYLSQPRIDGRDG